MPTPSSASKRKQTELEMLATGSSNISQSPLRSSRRQALPALLVDSSDDEDDAEDGNVHFVAPVDLTPRDAALSLLNQFLKYCPDTTNEEDDRADGGRCYILINISAYFTIGLTDMTDNESDALSSDVWNQIVRMIESLQLELSSSKDNDIFSLVLLGRNGDGKSSLINFLLSLFAPLDSEYGFRGLKLVKYCSSRLNRKGDGELRDRLMSVLEALKYLRSKDNFEVFAE
jgi:hypothetical protein